MHKQHFSIYSLVRQSGFHNFKFWILKVCSERNSYSRMDLSTLKKQLDGGSLSGMSDFKRNVLLMFANAVMFNSTGHDVNHYAKEMAVDTLSSLKVFIFFL